MVIRTTEQLAPEMLAKLTRQLTQLTTDQPTAVEIEEALLSVLPQIAMVLRDWKNSRRLGYIHAQQAAKFRESHPQVAEVMARLTPPQAALRQIADIPTATPEEDAVFDEMERRSLHPIFHTLLGSVRPA